MEKELDQDASSPVRPHRQSFNYGRALNHVLDLIRKLTLFYLVFLCISYAQTRSAWLAHAKDVYYTNGIKWGSCYSDVKAASSGVQIKFNAWSLRPIEFTFKKDEPTMTCTRIDVPLTYDKNDNRTISIPLARRRANATVSGNPIFLNPGGPGGSGVGWALLRNFSQELVIFGGSRDLISFDPRGVNGSIPAMSCFTDPESRTLWKSETGGLLRSAADSIARLWASNRVLRSVCEQNAADIGPYISTWYVAHDMRYMASKIYGESCDEVKLNYWGFSYGTILGMTYNILFPDNVGKFIIDGVVDLYDWYTYDWSPVFVSTGHVESHFYDSCAAHPKSCPLAIDSSTSDKRTRSPDEIKTVVYDLLESLKLQPLPSTDVGLVTYTSVKSYIIQCLYRPTAWSTMATFLNDTMHHNTTVKHEDRDNNDESALATGCGDSHHVHYSSGIEYISQTLDIMETASPFFGDYWAAEVATRCQFYPFTPKTLFGNQSTDSIKATRMNGNRDGSNILFASLAYDLVTPLTNARAMHAEFKDSHLLIVKDGYGHCSTSMKSSCAHRAIAQWMLHGTASNETMECHVDAGHGAFEDLGLSEPMWF